MFEIKTLDGQNVPFIELGYLDGFAPRAMFKTAKEVKDCLEFIRSYHAEGSQYGIDNLKVVQFVQKEETSPEEFLENWEAWKSVE
jgi:hypothetical protein